MPGRTIPLDLRSPPTQDGPRTAGRVLRALIHIVALALVIAGLVAALSDTGTAVSSPPAAAALDPEEQRFLDLINAYRAGTGLPTLSIDPQLQAASRWMSEDMATKDYFSHYDSLGRDPFQRMAANGYAYDVWRGENLAAGTAEAEAAFDLWKASPGHNANMVNQQFHGVGISRAYGPASGLGWYWTTDFGGIAHVDAPAEPPASPTPTATQGPASFAAPTPTTTPTPVSTPPGPADPAPPGDRDCDVLANAGDALAPLRIVAGAIRESFGLGKQDLSGNNLTDTGDAPVLLQHIADLPSTTDRGCPRASGSSA